VSPPIRILLVEDEALIALSERLGLADRGYEVVHEESAERALRRMREGLGKIDLVLMDVNLGQGMDGILAALELQKASAVPLIFLTSRSESEIASRAAGLTAWDYVSKGRSLEALDEAIRRALDRRRAPPP
jgi:DNA-binding response OmpR family regulator